MRRRTFMQAGPGFCLCPQLRATLNQSGFESAAVVLQAAVDSRRVDAASLYVRQGATVFSQGFGHAKSKDSMFLLASISKPITVAAVMSLYDQGEFALEDPVHKFLPEFKGDGRERITIRHLLTHTSGLPDQLPENAKLRAAHASLSHFVDGALRTPLLFPPGSKYGYSSMAILLASEIGRRISGKTIDQLVADEVVRPLELNRMALGVGSFDLKSLMQCQVENAAPESGSGSPETRSWDWNSEYWRKLGVPWGGAHGSASNVARFLNAFLHPEGKLLNPETARLMIRNHNAAGLQPRGLGFDLGLGLYEGARSNMVFGHTGSTGTMCWADAKTDSVCVILTTLPARAVNPHPRNVVARRLTSIIE